MTILLGIRDTFLEITKLYESHPQGTEGFNIAQKDLAITEDERDITAQNYSFENNFQCAYCFTELGNKYLSCKGCEAIGRSYKLCVPCFNLQTPLKQDHYFSDVHKLQNSLCNHLPLIAKKDKFDTNNDREMVDVGSEPCNTCDCKLPISQPVCHNCYYARYRFYNDQSMKSLVSDLSQYKIEE